MINSASETQIETKVKRLELEKVILFKYLEAVVSSDGLRPEVLSRTVQATIGLNYAEAIMDHLIKKCEVAEMDWQPLDNITNS